MTPMSNSTQNNEIKQMEKAIREGFAESEKDLRDKRTPLDKSSTQNNHEMHTACIERIKKEGASATCCHCNPHDGCTLEMKPTQNDWAKQIIFHLENLIIDIGTQVTDDYKEKNGLYEGMSIKNVISRDKYKKIFIELLADARKEVFTRKEKDYMIALLTIVQTEIETDRALGMRVDNRGEKMCNNILTILRG